MTAGILSGSVVAIIAACSVIFLAVGMYMFGAMHGWEPTPRQDRDGSGLERIRCTACGAVRFHREPHQCAKQPTVVPAVRYDRPIQAPPIPLPPPGVYDPIEAKAR